MATEDELAQIQQCDSFTEGIRFWATQRDPLPFNVWQQGVSQVRGLFKDDPGVPVPGPDFTAVVSALWKEVMTDIHGPEWRRSIVRAVSKAETRVGPSGAAGASSPAAGPMPVPPTPKQTYLALQAQASSLQPPKASGAFPLTLQGEERGPAPQVPGGDSSARPPFARGPLSASGRLEAPYMS